MIFAVVFEIPDEEAEDMARVGAQVIEMYASAGRQGAAMPDFWQFPGHMVPVAVAGAETKDGLVAAVGEALSSAS